MCQIEGLDDTVATIYNTSPLVKKSGSSVDVKVDVKNVTEPEHKPDGTGGHQARYFIRILNQILPQISLYFHELKCWVTTAPLILAPVESLGALLAPQCCVPVCVCGGGGGGG